MTIVTLVDSLHERFPPPRGLRRQRPRDHDEGHGPRPVLGPAAPSHRRGRASTGHRVSSLMARPRGGSPGSSGASRQTSGTSSTRRSASGSPGFERTRQGEAGFATTQLEGFPSPDLAIEIDISPPKVDRPGIYAALGVAEVWRFDGDVAVIERLTPEAAMSPSRRVAGWQSPRPTWCDGSSRKTRPSSSPGSTGSRSGPRRRSAKKKP